MFNIFYEDGEEFIRSMMSLIDGEKCLYYTESMQKLNVKWVQQRRVVEYGNFMSDLTWKMVEYRISGAEGNKLMDANGTETKHDGFSSKRAEYRDQA